MFKTIGGRTLSQFVRAALVVMLAVSCTFGRNRAEGPEGPFGTGQATLDYIEGLGFTADSSYIASYTCDECRTAGVRLMFLPRDDAQEIDWKKRLRPHEEGEVVAQIANVDNVEFKALNLKPGEVAYAWVGEIEYNGSVTRGFGVYKLDAGGHAVGSPWYLTPIGQIEFCKKGQNEPKRKKPAIKDKHYQYPGIPELPNPCKPIQQASLSGETRLASLGASVAYAAEPRANWMTLAVGKLWISCAGGCCQVSPN